MYLISFHFRDQIAEKLINAIENADEIFLQPLYDLTEAFAKDIQATLFWPYFDKFLSVFGTTLLNVKDYPEVVQSGYTALSNIVRLVLRNADQDQSEIKSFDILKISLEGLMKTNKGLPGHSQKLCASALGQIIRRSRTKTSCIEVKFSFDLYNCKKSVKLQMDFKYLLIISNFSL